ncbi:MAG TPA: hypothetical protein VGY97_10020 [Solirubrobacteraceae bacterium]|jgi:hypothetical protein|nr:hypothetical protein [Solirubrobacteraceae bacterium]
MQTPNVTPEHSFPTAHPAQLATRLRRASAEGAPTELTELRWLEAYEEAERGWRPMPALPSGYGRSHTDWRAAA